MGNACYPWFMVEQWLPVVGYEGYYEVSDQGRVRSVPRVTRRGNGRPMSIRGTVRKQSTMPKGHKSVTLVRDKQLRTFTVHKLVLLAFKGAAEEGQMCRHLNGDPTDNRLSNLAWGTGSENQNDAVRHGSHYLSQKTHCVRGHPLAPPNLAKSGGSNRRVCLACHREGDSARAEGRSFDPVRADARYEDVIAGRRRHKSERRF